MPIRDANTLFFPRSPSADLFSNRGVSGIDGNIATTVGIAKGTGKKTLAVIGDLAALHDLNSLALIKEAQSPLFILVINNGGGGIFSFLPIAERKEPFERFWAAAHQTTFEHAAHLFALPYYSPRQSEGWREGLANWLKSGKSSLIEVRTNRDENVLTHKKMEKELSYALSC
jgi:2-succinyl-5-enolpyruvyl-6-hydroxy-3-cyclohexene-1-carboxylate synthase